MDSRRNLLCLVALSWSLLAHSATAADFSPEFAGFELRVGEERNPYRILGVSVAPVGTLDLEILSPGAGSKFEVRTTGGTLDRLGPFRWNWNAPAFPGLFRIVIEGSNERTMTLNVFVTVPRSQIKSGRLNGYRIGSYPKKPLKGNPIYNPPPGFIEITDALENTPVSPHFRLGQFRCKQEGGPQSYVVLRTRLVLKLERLLREVNELGYAAGTFHVMSGYRTPWYNAAIGNVKYSRHAWGGAADIFIDEKPEDGRMDDLDRNGRIDLADAAVLQAIVEELDLTDDEQRFQGGLAKYGSTATHGPFVHIDVRGRRARW